MIDSLPFFTSCISTQKEGLFSYVITSFPTLEVGFYQRYRTSAFNNLLSIAIPTLSKNVIHIKETHLNDGLLLDPLGSIPAQWPYFSRSNGLRYKCNPSIAMRQFNYISLFINCQLSEIIG